jgi:hypothetical protein
MWQAIQDGPNASKAVPDFSVDVTLGLWQSVVTGQL